MKRIILVWVAILAIGSVNAQVVWGVRAGVSRPTAKASFNDGYGWRSFSIDGEFGFEAGPVLYYSLKNNFYINSGIMFSTKTFKDDYSNSSFSMHYLDIPLYLGVSIPIGKLSTYLQAGPFVGFKLAENYKNREGDEDSGTKSFNAGLGIMYGININRFKIEAGYQYGLTNILDTRSYDDEDYDDYDDYDEKLTIGSLFIGVSYIF